MIRRILCFFGIHKFDQDEWVDRHDEYGDYVYSANVCEKCNKYIIKKLD